MKVRQDERRYHAVLQLVAVFLCALGNSFFIDGNTFLFFVLPGITWAFSLLLPIHRFVEEKQYAYLMFPMAMFTLWLLMITMGVVLGSILLALSPLLAFPLLGAISAICAYLLYAKIVLNVYDRRDAVLSFFLGYLSFVAFMLVTHKGGQGLKIDVVFLYWQPLVGWGMTKAYLRPLRKTDKPAGQLT